MKDNCDCGHALKRGGSRLSHLSHCLDKTQTCDEVRRSRTLPTDALSLEKTAYTQKQPELHVLRCVAVSNPVLLCLKTECSVVLSASVIGSSTVGVERSNCFAETPADEFALVLDSLSSSGWFVQSCIIAEIPCFIVHEAQEKLK